MKELIKQALNNALQISETKIPKTMKVQDLVKHQIYKNITDLDVPIMFLNIEYKETENSNDYFICRFKTVKTEKNKNWGHGEILLRFHTIDGNNLITL